MSTWYEQCVADQAVVQVVLQAWTGQLCLLSVTLPYACTPHTAAMVLLSYSMCSNTASAQAVLAAVCSSVITGSPTMTRKKSNAVLPLLLLV